ncbi:MAG: acetyl-CoA C-acetyltransferase [Pseudomonadota bacterium]
MHHSHIRHAVPRAVYLVEGLRTPFLKFRNRPGPARPSELGTQVMRSLLLRQPFSPDKIDEVILGCMIPGPDEANIARVVALRAGCSVDTIACTVQRNCASALQAIASSADRIALGYSDLIITGGTEAMSHAPLLWSTEFVTWFSAFQQCKDWKKKLTLLASLRPHLFKPVIALLKGLADPLVNLSMGQTAEELAYRFGISRFEMDAMSVRSHQRATQAQADILATELMTYYGYNGQIYAGDDGVRADSTVEKLGQLKPVFDKFGNITAANSSQVSDGACAMLLASEDAVSRYGLKPLARILDLNWGALPPEIMGLGPVHAIVPMLKRQNLSMSDIDAFEINEAFAAQVIACQRAVVDPTYLKGAFGSSESLGEIPDDRLNIDGGAISIGHPVGASGARLVLRLCHILRRTGGKLGVASLCIGGGQGGAILIENLT